MSDQPDPPLATTFPAVVVIRRQAAVNRWQRHSWRLAEIVLGRSDAHARSELQLRCDGERYIWSGLVLQLYKDQAESYYHNLLAPQPSVYVVTRRDELDCPEPFLVSASFDEAHAYMETDDGDAHALPLPPVLLEPLERFVLTHYVPEPRRKRRRQDWKNQAETRERR